MNIHPGYVAHWKKLLAEARKIKHSIVLFESDWGGCTHVICPTTELIAEDDTLISLLLDIEGIAWGPVFPYSAKATDTDAIFVLDKNTDEHNTNEKYVEMNGQYIGPIWIHNELIEYKLADQVLDVLSGKQACLKLIESCSRPLASFDEAQRHGNGVVHCHSTTRDSHLFSSTTDTICVDEFTLHGIAESLDRALGLPIQSMEQVWNWGKPTFKYQVAQRIKRPDEDTSMNPIVSVITCPQSSIIRSQLIAALRGEVAPEDAFHW